RSQKVFKSIVPDPKSALDPNDPRKSQRFDTKDFPIQSFLWGDYGAVPDTAYRFRILPMYGKPGALTSDPQDELRLEIKTEKEWEEGASHGVWFNRGAIASQKFAEEFGNAPPKNIDDPTDPEVVWLSRGLLEACLNYIKGTPAGDGLRVAAYEFTYAPILNELKRAIDRGVDVQIAYHDTSDAPGQPNETAMQTAGIPVNDQKTTFRRSRTKIPHNKFIVRLRGRYRSCRGMDRLDQFHRLRLSRPDERGASRRPSGNGEAVFEYWKLVKTDPQPAATKPAEALAARSVVGVFSPRNRAELLGWYGRRMLDCANSVWFTAAFGVTAELVEPIAKQRDQMRFVLMEKPATDAVKRKLTEDATHVVLSYGIPLGELYTMKDGKPTARKPIQEFALDKWFFNEELYRPKNDGFVFFVHTKFLLIDPLSDDPLVCSGSANFSPDSLLQNDENMLLIR